MSNAVNKKILIEGGPGEIKIFFDENLYAVNREDVKTSISAAIMNGLLTGADLDGLDYGTIVCKYNPVRVDIFSATIAAKQLAELIESCAPAGA